uniref:RNase H type-1 domain-containing protein n=1 Tax=Arion vulgaris TaxID=1028688 RepID=A0A0B7B776_9EUPU
MNATIQTLAFIFVPGYSGVMGNERVDALMSNAAIENGPSMDKRYVINALRRDTIRRFQQRK